MDGRTSWHLVAMTCDGVRAARGERQSRRLPDTVSLYYRREKRLSETDVGRHIRKDQ
jgi:hypothetical protein